MSIETTKKEVLDIIKKDIKRDGIDKMVEFLNTSDFFTAPASTQHHGSESGGLANHSLLVYRCLVKKAKEYMMTSYSAETLAIAGLFHDICKVNFYKRETDPASTAQINFIEKLCAEYPIPADLTKSHASTVIDHFKKNGKLEDVPKQGIKWIVDDEFPMGHGEKSAYVVERYIRLTDEEALAIKHHSGQFNPAVYFQYPHGYAFKKALSEFPLVPLLMISDLEVSQLLHV